MDDTPMQRGPNTHRMDAPADVTEWTVIPTTRNVVTDDGRGMTLRDEWWEVPSFVVAEIERTDATPASEPPADLRAALDFLRKRLVGTPPNVDMEDAYMASLLDEAEAVGRAALSGDRPSPEADPQPRLPTAAGGHVHTLECDGCVRLTQAVRLNEAGTADHAPDCDVNRPQDGDGEWGEPLKCTCGFIPAHVWDPEQRQWVASPATAPAEGLACRDCGNVMQMENGRLVGVECGACGGVVARLAPDSAQEEETLVRNLGKYGEVDE